MYFVSSITMLGEERKTEKSDLTTVVSQQIKIKKWSPNPWVSGRLIKHVVTSN